MQRLKTVILWPDGTVMSLNENDLVMPELSGTFSKEVHDNLLMYVTADTEFREGYVVRGEPKSRLIPHEQLAEFLRQLEKFMDRSSEAAEQAVFRFNQTIKEPRSESKRVGIYDPGVAEWAPPRGSLD